VVCAERAAHKSTPPTALCRVTNGILVRAARNLIIIGAAQFSRPRRPSVWRDFARSGFHRRNKGCSLRAIGGVWLRRRLNARGGVIAQAKHLIQVMRHFRALAGAFARRRRSGLTRLRPLVLATPLAQPAVSLNVAAPLAADSS
jgi:hypothetical protein